jgi:flagellar motor switch protein FliN
MNRMSASTPANTADLLQWLGETWAVALAEVIEGLAGQKPESTWRPPEGAAAATGAGAALVWQQGFDISEDALAWASVPEAAWKTAGANVLTAAGDEEPADDEVRGTAVEILGQSFARLAQMMAEKLGRPVASLAGVECDRIPEALPAGSVELRFAGVPAGPLRLFCSPPLAVLLSGSPPAQTASEPVAAEAPPEYAASSTLDLLRDMELPVSVSFGRTELPLQEVLKLAAGSVIELDRSVSDPVALVVNNTVVALGEVVVIEGNYGLRISEILSRERLIRSSGLV